MAVVNRKMIWAGWVLTILPCLLFIMSSAMKFQGGPDVVKGMAHLGIPTSMMKPLAVLEITCVIIYLIPATSVLGAVLLTGYIGGAMCAHWRAGDAFYIHIILGLVVWLGIYLREDRLWSVLPIRKP